MSPDPKDPRRALPLSDAEIAGTAAAWIARRDAGLSAVEQAELRTWLRLDPRHAKALASADVRPSALNWPLHVGAAERIAAGLEERARRRRSRRRRLASAGCAALLLLSAGFFFSRRIESLAPSTIVVHAPRQQILSDGSRLELKDGAEIAVAFTASERRIELLRGTAHFDVRKDAARPFLVSVGNVTARAVGTAFALGLEGQQVALLVTEGRVAVDPRTTSIASQPASPEPAVTVEPLAYVQAGEAISIATSAPASAAPTVAALSPSELDNRLAWRIPRLEFSSTPLHDVIKTVNRYNREQLEIGDASLANLKLSGALRANRIDGLLEILEAEFHITAVRGEGRIILQRP